jgi:hypothetical protein
MKRLFERGCKSTFIMKLVTVNSQDCQAFTRIFLITQLRLRFLKIKDAVRLI